MLRSAILAAAVIGLSAAPALADDVKAEMADAVQIGPTVGAAAPAFTLTTTDGQPATLETISGTNGTALVFVRSADWCPFCKKQIAELNAAKVPLAEAGWSLAAVSYDSPETLATFTTNKGISYPLLSDTGSAVIKAMGLLNTDNEPGSRFYGIPHPAIVFIRADGTVAAVMREEGYRDRPQVDVVIEAASLLNEAAG